MRTDLSFARGLSVTFVLGGMSMLLGAACGAPDSAEHLGVTSSALNRPDCVGMGVGPDLLYVNSCGNALWPTSLQASSDTAALAPGALAIIPYSFGSATDSEKSVITTAMAAWEAKTAGRVVFRPFHAGDIRWLNIHDEGGVCGFADRSQSPAVDFGSNCTVGGNAEHELGHMVAFEHSHQRNDRERYLTFASHASCGSDILHSAPNSPSPRPGGNGPGGTFGVFDKQSVMMYASVFTGYGAPTSCSLHLGGGDMGSGPNDCNPQCTDCCRGFVLNSVPTPATPPCPADLALNPHVSSGDGAAALEAYTTKQDWAPFESVAVDKGPTTPLDFSLQAGIYPVGNPAVASLGFDATVVVTRGSDGNLWSAIDAETSQKDSVLWTSLGAPPSTTFAGDPAVVSSSQFVTHFDIAVVGITNGVRTVWTRAVNSVGPNAWTALPAAPGPLSTGVALASWGTNRLDLFVNGTDGRLWHTCPSCSPITTWDNPGGTLAGGQFSAPAATSWGNNRIDVVAASGGALWEMSFSGTSWSSWINIRSATAQPALTGSPALASSGPAHLDVFMKTVDEQLFHGSCLIGPCVSAGQWGHWEVLGGVLKSSPAASSPRSLARIDVFAASNDGTALPVPTNDLGLWHKWWPWGKNKRERISGGPSRSSVHGDIDGDGISDIVMAGGSGWASLPVAISKPDNSFSPLAPNLANFPTWAQVSGARPVSGDFNGDGRSDVALVGGLNVDSVPVAASNGDGSFTVLSPPSFAVFTALAQISGVKAVSGDFDGDGRDDIALVGGPGWSSIPSAVSTGDGGFQFKNTAIASFQAFAGAAGAQVVSGDFNGDAFSDIALVGGAGWTDIKIAYSNGDGTFHYVSVPTTAFPVWTQTSGAKAVSGDFNGDGLGDIALTGGAGWASIPVAFAKADGTFNPLAIPSDFFPAWAQTSGATPVSGDFNGDGKGDIAMVSGAGWDSNPVALSNGDGTFKPASLPTSAYPTWSRTSGAKPASY